MATDTQILQMEPTKSQGDLGKWMVRARQESRKGLASQVAEIALLSRGEGRLAPEEYFQFRLFDDARYSRDEKRSFLGKSGSAKIYRKVISPYHTGVWHDKVAADALLRGAGLPCAETYALYHPLRACRAVPVLRDAKELAGFLREGMTYPFFEKPVHGWQSRGVAHIERYDAARDLLVHGDGSTSPVTAFAEEIAKLENGALFQELLRPHPEAAALCGDRVSTLRAILLVDERPRAGRRPGSWPAGCRGPAPSSRRRDRRTWHPRSTPRSSRGAVSCRANPSPPPRPWRSSPGSDDPPRSSCDEILPLGRFARRLRPVLVGRGRLVGRGGLVGLVCPIRGACAGGQHHRGRAGDGGGRGKPGVSARAGHAQRHFIHSKTVRQSRQ